MCDSFLTFDMQIVDQWHDHFVEAWVLPKNILRPMLYVYVRFLCAKPLFFFSHDSSALYAVIYQVASHHTLKRKHLARVSACHTHTHKPHTCIYQRLFRFYYIYMAILISSQYWLNLECIWLFLAFMESNKHVFWIVPVDTNEWANTLAER